jgi:hypothetical protein
MGGEKSLAPPWFMSNCPYHTSLEPLEIKNRDANLVFLWEDGATINSA